MRSNYIVKINDAVFLNYGMRNYRDNSPIFIQSNFRIRKDIPYDYFPEKVDILSIEKFTENDVLVLVRVGSFYEPFYIRFNANNFDYLEYMLKNGANVIDLYYLLEEVENGKQNSS